jgi:hypothetical protein
MVRGSIGRTERDFFFLFKRYLFFAILMTTDYLTKNRVICEAEGRSNPHYVNSLNFRVFRSKFRTEQRSAVWGVPEDSRRSRIQRRFRDVVRNSGPMRTVGVVQAGVVNPQVVKNFAGDDGAGDDPGDVLELDAAVPDALGVDDDGRAMLALVETTGVVGPDPSAEAGGFEFFFEGVAQRLVAVRVAATATMTGGALVAANEDVVAECGHNAISRSSGSEKKWWSGDENFVPDRRCVLYNGLEPSCRSSENWSRPATRRI